MTTSLKDVSTEALQAELKTREQEVAVEAPPSLNVSVFYRGIDKSLHRTDVACNTVKEATQAVMEQLSKDKEKFLRPVLALIHCGNSVPPFVVLPRELA